MNFGEFTEYMRDFNAVSVLVRIILCVITGGLIGLERGKTGRAAGMRTHILVCVGASLTVMVGLFCTKVLGYSTDPMRIAAQVVSGIGFLGVGTILIKGRFMITGLTTAAGLWATATIGLAAGVGFYEGALLTFAVTILTVTIFHKIEYKLNKHLSRFGIYIEVKGCENIRPAINLIKENYTTYDIQVTSPRSGIQNNVGIEANIIGSKTPPDETVRDLEKNEVIIFALESI